MAGKQMHQTKQQPFLLEAIHSIISIKRSFCCTILLAIVFSLSTASAQQDSSEIEMETVKDQLPRFDIHIGAGWVNGGRIGSRILFHENISLEISVGTDIRNLIGASDPASRYSIGVNWHIQNSYPLVVSFLFVRDKKTNLTPSPSYLMSANIGFILFKESGLHLFERAGIYTEILSDRPAGNTTLGFNVDIGLAFVFP